MSKTPFTRRKSFIASVGALLTAGVALAAHWLGWSGEDVAIVLAFVGAGLAVWRSGVSPADNNKGMAQLDVLRVVSAMGMLCVFVALVVLTSNGCGTVNTHARQSVSYELWKADCRMIVDADGAEVFVLTSDPDVDCAMICHDFASPPQ